MRSSSVAILIVAVAMGLLAAFLVRNLLVAQGSASAGKIIVAALPLGFGTQLTNDNVVEIEWPSGRSPVGAFATRQELFKDGSRVVLSPMERNEPILTSKITGPGQQGSLSALLKEDMRAVTVRVDDVRGVAGFILPGDRVDIVLIRTSGAGRDESYADVIVQNVKVLAVDQKANERTDKANVAKAVTVAVSPEDAQKILLATDIGRLSLTLREPGQNGQAAMRRITERDLALGGPRAAAPAKVASTDTMPMQRPLSRNTTVVIFHGMKSQEYSVIQDGM